MRQCSWFFVVLSSALAIGLTSTAVSAADNGGHRVDMRVANFNIHSGMDSGENFDLERTAQAIADLDADVVALQEVDVRWDPRSQWRDLASELAEALDMRVYFGHIYRDDPPHPGAPRPAYGNAILSKHPIVSARNHHITRLSTQVPDPEPELMPGFPRVTVLAAGIPVQVYSTHLDYRAEPDIRQAQVSDTRAIMEAEDSGPQLLLGDFNAPPDAGELTPLWRDLTDAWTTSGNGGGYTYPSTAPDTRIDYIATSDSVDITEAWVDDTLASDHRPVVADIMVGF